MTSAITTTPGMQVPAQAAKKSRTPRKPARAPGIFGLLPDWKIDTQAFSDEQRD